MGNHTGKSKLHPRACLRRWGGPVLGLVLGPLAVGSAQALQFDLGPKTDLSWTTTLGYSTAYRVQGKNNDILANINADDGDRAFNKGIFKNEVSAITELNLRRGDYGLFVRGDAFFDAAYNHNSDNNSAATDNTPSNPPYKFVRHTRHVNRSDVRLLDAFVYGDFDIGSTDLNMRVGRQVVSWGESLFVPGISATQNPVDVTQTHSPATEVKKVLLPVGTILGRWRLTSNLSVASYYQWEWDHSRLDGSGSYFSQSDLLSGGEVSLRNVPGTGIVPVLRHTQNDDAKNSGQYGFDVHYTVPSWAYTDFGAYYVRYHDKSPSVIIGGFGAIPGQPNVPTTYHAKYFEDIDLYGLSMATAFGRVQLGAEASYKDGTPVLDQSQVAVRAKVAQVQANTITNLPVDLFWANTTTITAEVGANTVTDRDDNELLADKTAAGYQGQLSLSYTNVMPSLDLTVPLSIKGGFFNDSSVLGTFTTGELQFSIGANFIYRDNWQVNIGYVQFHGGADDSPLTDRDFVSADVRYTF